MTALATFEPHPPFYYAMLHVWLGFAGDSEFGLRFPSVLLGTFAVACVIRAGREVGGPTVGFASGVLLAVSQYALLQSQDARMYAALQAWVALYLLGLVRYLRRPTRSNSLVVFVGGALAAFTHYHGLLLVALGAIPVLVLGPRRDVLARLVPYLALAAIYLPWAIFARRIFTSYQGWMDVVSPSEMVRRTIEAYGFVGTGPATSIVPLVFPLLALTGTLALIVARQGRWIFVLLCLGALPLLVVMVGNVFGRPLYSERYLVVLTPAYTVLAGVGLASLARSWLTSVISWGAVAGLSAMSLSAYYQPSSPPYPDFRATVQLIEREAVLPAIVLSAPPQGPNVAYYLKDRLPSYTARGTASPATVASDLRGRLVGMREAWFVRYSSGDWDSSIGRWLESNAYFVRDQWITQNHIVTYAVAPSDGMSERSDAAQVADGLTITQIRVGPAQAKPSDRFFAGVQWKLSAGQVQPPSMDAKVSFRLIDPWGQTVAALDRRLVNPGELPGENLPRVVQAALPIPSDAVPGAYRVEARFYDGATGTLWPVRDEGGEGQPALAIGAVTVVPAVAVSADVGEPIDPKAVVLGDGLYAEGISLAGAPYTPDGTVVASFDWAATAAQAGSVVPEIALRSASGQVVASIQRADADQPYPLRLLRAGERVRERLELPLRSVAVSGTYAVLLRVSPERPWGQLGSIDVAVDSSHYARPAATNARSDLFANAIRLVGLDLSSEAVPAGGSLRVRLVWHADGLPPAQYTVFIHLVPDGGDIPLAQSDGIPSGGKRPTLGWAVGEYVVDDHTIVVPTTLTPGSYRLLAGLYQAESGRRADVASSAAEGQAVVLGQVTVTSP